MIVAKKTVQTEETKEETALQTQGTTAVAEFDYGDDAVDVSQVPQGAEHQTSQDLTVPFWKLIQPGTPGFADGTLSERVGRQVKLGEWINSATGQVLPKLLFVCGTTRHDYKEWKDIEEGGGLVGSYDIDSEVVAAAKKASEKFGKYKHPETGNALVESFYMFGSAIDPESGDVVGMGVLPFKSTGIKAYKAAMNQVRAATVPGPGGKKVRPPLWAHLMEFTSEVCKEDKNTWAEPRYRPAKGTILASLLERTHPAFITAKACKELMETGQAKVDYNQEGSTAETKGAQDDPF
jgi:hypothetical protein